MNKHLLVTGILLTLLVYGCSNDQATKTEKDDTSPPTQETAKEKNETKDNPLEKAEKQVDAQLVKKLKTSLENQDKEAFLQLFNKDNQLFYKEQERWFEEYVYLLNDDYKIAASIENVELVSSEKGLVSFSTFIERPSGESLNASVTYGISTMVTDSEKWKINGMQFIKLEEGLITVNYLDGQKEPATNMLNHAKKIVGVYKNNFKWQVEEINIKLFKTSNELVATIPFWTDKALGWNEYQEAIKVVVNENEEATNYILEHEIAHQLLSDLTNDNGPIWFQEGFANYLPEGLTKHSDGSVSFDISKSNKASQSMIDRLEGNVSFPKVSAISKEKYLDIYGYLFINYLIQEHSFDTFMGMLTDLRKNPYIDKRIAHKTDQMDKLLLETIERHYGSLEDLSVAYRSFYN